MNKVSVEVIASDEEAARKEGARQLEVKPEEVLIERSGESAFLVSLANAPGTFRIETSTDGMCALLEEIRPPVGKGQAVTFDHVMKALDSNKVVFGIQEKAIQEVVAVTVSSNQALKKIPIAKGDPPCHGKDGRLRFFFETSLSVGKHVRSTGRIDFKKRGMLQNVKAGALLAERTLPTLGKEGKDIFGRTVPCRHGREKKLASQGNVAVSRDGLRYTAQIDGAVSLVGADKIGVFRLFRIPKDVDYSTGHVTMDGSLEIKGWIRTGFTVRASGDIFVEGGVENAAITAGSNLEVIGGIIGRSNKTVRSGGTIRARFVENGLVEAASDIEVRDSIIRSNVSTQGRLSVSGGKGRIIGGIVSAEKGVEATELGSRGGAKTVVEVGINPAVSALIQQHERELRFARRNEDKVRTGLSWLTRKSRKGTITHKEAAILAKLRRFRRTTVQKTAKLARYRKHFARTIREREDEPASVKVHQAVHRGTVIVVNGHTLHVEEEIRKGGTFVLDMDLWAVRFIS